MDMKKLQDIVKRLEDLETVLNGIKEEADYLKKVIEKLYEQNAKLVKKYGKKS